MSRHPVPSNPNRSRRVAIRLVAAFLAVLIAGTGAAMVAKPASAADAPFCPSGKTPSWLFRDDMENPASGKWAFAHGAGTTNFSYVTDKAASGTRSLNAPQLDTLSDMRATRTANLTLPTGTATYLRFNHLDGFYDDYDGGVVEYSTNGGQTWVDAGPMFIDNGYTGVIGTLGSSSPLRGREAFNGASAFWAASRLDLSPLAGQAVKIRFRVANDDIVGGGPGWHLDDVDIYTCVPIILPGAPTNVTATAANRSATVTWTPPASTGNTTVTGYLVLPLVNGEPGGSMVWAPPTATSATVKALVNGTGYTFQVFTQAEGGTGPASVPSGRVVPRLPSANGSLVFIKNNNVWLSGPYGQDARALTTDGTADIPYWSPSQSDDGNTIVAVRNERVGLPGSQFRQGRVFVMTRQGTVVRTFAPADQYVPTGVGCRGAWGVTPLGIEKAVVSPDGTKVAYGPYAVVDGGTTSCSLTNIGKAFVSNIDGTNPVQLRANDGNDNFMHPSWVTKTRLLVRLGYNYDSAIYLHDVGGQTTRWFGRAGASDNFAFRDPALRGTKLAEITDYSELRLWTTNGALPAAPSRRCVISNAHGAGDDYAYFRHPTWSPSGAVLAWEEAGGPADRADEGIYVSPVGDITQPANCPSHDTATLVIQGGTQPSWGPAPVVAAPPTLKVSDASVTEGATGTTTTLRFKVALSAASPTDVTVRFATADGTATAGADYNRRSTTMTIPAGILSKPIKIVVNGDAAVEPNETLTVALSSPVGATILDGQAIGTITNDD